MKFGKISLRLDYEKAGVTKKDDYTPHMDAYILDEPANPFRRRAVLICPGGGYEFTSEREAEPIAMKFLAEGIQAFILWYSVRPAVYPMALMEAAKAVALIREHAKAWNVDADKIVVMGFSAGGHLAGDLACTWNKPFLSKITGLAPDEMRPNGSLLCYPVITSGKHAHRGSFDALLDGLPDEMLDETSLELQVTGDVPPTFIWTTWNDETVPVENTLLYIAALRKAGVSCEAHIFRSGVHGLSRADRETAGSPVRLMVAPEVAVWMDLAVTWIRNL